MSKQLHITNGDDLTSSILELKLPGEVIVWREMLCEGPTTYHLDTPEFFNLRSAFFENTYHIDVQQYQEQFVRELERLDAAKGYDEIILWFEFDLFSHINMLALISHLLESGKKIPVFLVCSGRLKGEKELYPLSQLPSKHLKNHYEQRIALDLDDLELANFLWQLYNGNNPQKLKSHIKKKNNFEYLSSCIRTHLERFPNSRTGLNVLERNVLKLIQKNRIHSLNHLVGYSLEYQGYFGLVDLQVERMIKSLEMFYEVGQDKITLTTAGEEALAGSRNFYSYMKNDEYYGGVKKYDFLYDSESHNILKL